MAKIDSVALYEIIKHDDLVSFSRLAEGKKTLLQVSLGRFPILSMCYLHNSNKIIKRYEKELMLVSSYNIISEPYSLSQHFAHVAGRALRLYTDGMQVSPLEMLAILGKDNRLKKLYLKMHSNDGIECRLQTIYQDIGSRTFIYNNGKLKISHKKLTRYGKSLLTTIVAVCMSFAIVMAGLGGAYVGIYGDGVIKDAQIYTEGQLIKALSQASGRYVLKNDITIEDIGDVENFGGVLDGNGHIVEVLSNSSSLINKLNGSIKNAHFVFSSKSFGASSSWGLITNSNYGVIDNVKLSVNGEMIQVRNKQEYLYFAGVAVDNYGIISSVQVDVKLSVSSSGNGESFVSAIAGKNYGNINNCTVLEQSYISAQNVDAAGLVASNENNGIISNCTNFSHIEQVVTIDDWSPICAGIVAFNHGLVSKSANMASVNIGVSVTNETNGTTSTIGGVCGFNYKEIVECSNKGEIVVDTINQSVYAGGICGSSLSDTIDGVDYVGKISASGNWGKLNIQIDQEKTYGFIGGVVGFLQGYLESSFSIGEFTSSAENGKYYQGGLVGGCYVYTIQMGTQIMITHYYIDLNNNYYLYRDEVSYGISGFVSNYGVIYFNDNMVLEDLIECNTVDELIESGVYYE